MNTGYAAVQAFLAMLYAQRSSGSGADDQAEVSLLHSAIAISQWNTVAESETDIPVGRQLDAFDWEPDHGYACADGRVLLSLRSDENAWTELFLALDRSDLLADERFSTVESVRENERLLPDILAKELAARTCAEMEELVRTQLHGTLVPILDPADVLVHPQTSSLDFIEKSAHEMRLRFPVRRVSSSQESNGYANREANQS
jgi:crotonobetainyl-CoA:carnitine CoA-transferase CaiB-like acyl-CoA transferase